MEKDFDGWNEKKKLLNERIGPTVFKEREIWWCHVGINVGFEQDGRGDEFLRPVLVIRKFNGSVFWAVPLTMTHKRNEYYFPFRFRSSITSVAILSHVRIMDARRLERRMGDIPESDFVSLKEKLKALLP